MAEKLAHKVALSGAGGVGKTALLDSINTHYDHGYSIGLVGEAARGYFASHPDIPQAERYSFYHQARIQEMVIGVELHMHQAGHNHIFTDRSVFDAPVCVASSGDKVGAEELFNRARIWVPGKSEIAYSQIYILDPADVPFENDAERTEDEATRQLQHDMFLVFFRHHNVNHKLLSGTLDERTEQVLMELPSA